MYCEFWSMTLYSFMGGTSLPSFLSWFGAYNISVPTSFWDYNPAVGMDEKYRCKAYIIIISVHPLDIIFTGNWSQLLSMQVRRPANCVSIHSFIQSINNKGLCIPASSVNYRSHLRSAHQGDLIVPRIRLARYGQWAFAYAAPCVWNSLTTDLKDYNLSLVVFKRRLKSYFLDSVWFPISVL